MSIYLLAVLIIGGAIAAAVGGQILVRKRVRLEVLQAHHEVASVLMGLVGSLYGILVAFVVVALWGNFDEARKTVAAESNALADLNRLSRGIPAPAGPQLHQCILQYVEVVLSEEWALMEDRRFSPRADESVGSLWDTLTRFSPRDERERNLHLLALQTMERFTDQRRLRFVLATRSLPPLLWAMLLTGGVMVLGFANFFGVRYPRTQALMTAAVALLVGLSLFSVVALDQPFRGGVKVPKQEMEDVVRLLRQSP